MVRFARIATILTACVALLQEVAAELVDVFEQNSRHSISIVPLPDGAESPLDALESGQADLALVSNSQAYRPRVTTVMPLYPTVLHVFYRRDREFDDLRDLFVDGSVYAGPTESASRRLTMTVVESLGLSAADVDLVEEPVTPSDVIVLYLPASPGRIAERLEELGAAGQYRLLSLGTMEDIGTGSSLDRALLLNPRMTPYVLPLGTYGDVTPEAIVTLAVDKMLVADSQVPEAAVYDLISEIRRLQPALASDHPLLFKNLRDEFDPADSVFVLHPGAHAFVNRDTPDVYERYSGVAEVLITLLIGLVSGTFALVQIYNRRRKNRIDAFYTDIMAIRDTALKSNAADVRQAQVRKARELQKKAFEMLVDEKLAADESFRIFLALSNDIVDELQEK
ncbi:MAG: TAXI family TRAP transporter solute-binding subunit [Woeseiaceae bacterium]